MIIHPRNYSIQVAYIYNKRIVILLIMASQCDSNDDNIIDNGTDLNFDPFTYTCTDDKQYFLSDKVDPDNNFFSKLTVDSLYFTEEQFKQKCASSGIGQFSLIHFNCRSLASNFIKLKIALQLWSLNLTSLPSLNHGLVIMTMILFA